MVALAIAQNLPADVQQSTNKLETLAAELNKFTKKRGNLLENVKMLETGLQRQQRQTDTKVKELQKELTEAKSGHEKKAATLKKALKADIAQVNSEVTNMQQKIEAHITQLKGNK